MSHRLFLALILLIAAPLVLLGWLSASAYRDRDQQNQQRVNRLLQTHLATYEPVVAGLFDQYVAQLRQAIDAEGNSPLQNLQQNTSIVRAVVMVDAKGIQVYPPRPLSNSAEERSLAASWPAIIGSRPQLETPSIATTTSQSKKLFTRQIVVDRQDRQSIPPGESTTPPNAWQVWFMDEGMQLVYWQPVEVSFAKPVGKFLPLQKAATVTPEQTAMLGILLERSRWIADLTARLPDGAVDFIDTPYEPSSSLLFSDKLASRSSSIQSSGFISLVDQSGQLVYQWGDRSEPRKQPIATRALPPPLTNWQWQWHDDPLAPSTSLIPVWISLAGLGLILLVLGGYVLTSVRRQMDNAMRQVNFASQVSHELRTPLTNIRLYAELAQADIEKLKSDQAQKQLLKRLGVIDSESRRLGRLVSGVLEVIRSGTNRPLRMTPNKPDEIIRAVLVQFEPSLSVLNFQVDANLDASEEVLFDEDVLEMILVNLLSNVEKYAASGKYLAVSSKMDSENSASHAELVIQVADHGPGITKRHHKTVFKAFGRLDDSISSPSGTGIGLTIARRLAKRHRGTLDLVSHHTANTVGATFQLQLPVEKPTKDSPQPPRESPT